MTPGGDMDLL